MRFSRKVKVVPSDGFQKVVKGACEECPHCFEAAGLTVALENGEHGRGPGFYKGWKVLKTGLEAWVKNWCKVPPPRHIF